MADQENTADVTAPADNASVVATDQHQADSDEAQSAFDEVTGVTQPAAKKDEAATDNAAAAAKPEGVVKSVAEPAKTGEGAQGAQEGAKAESEKVTDIFPFVEKYHPGARAKAATPEFQGWLNALPKHYQDMIDRGDPVEAAMLLDMYDRETKDKHATELTKVETAQAQPVFTPLTFDAVKDIKIKGGDGQEMTLAKFAEEYGEVGEAALAIANQVVQAALKALPQQNQAQTANYLKKAELESFKSEIAAELFENRVERMHPGAIKKASSDEFKAYLKQAPPMQVKQFTYGSPQDVVAVLEEFDRIQAIEQAKNAQKKQVDKKKALDGLHGNSLRSATTVERAKKPDQAAVSPEQADVEAREGFDAALQEIENERKRR